MTWTRLSDDFTDRPLMLRISRSARLLHIEAMVWCNRHGQDGVVPASVLPRITDSADISADLNELSKAGIWAGIPDEPDLWQLDWSDQESAEEVRARAEYRANTQRRYRERKSKHDRGDHSACDPRFCEAAVIGNATANESDNETPSRPVPSRPLGRDRDQGAGIASAGATATRAPEGGVSDLPPVRRLPSAHHKRNGCCNLPIDHPIHREAT